MRITLLLLGVMVAVPAAAQEEAGTTTRRTGDRVHTGSQTVAADEEVADIVVVGGDLRVLGTVTGDAVVVSGDLILEASGAIQGDAIVTGGAIVNNGGRIAGEMRTISGGGSVGRGIAGAVAGATAGAAEGRAAARAAREAARETRTTVHSERRAGRSDGVFGPIRRGFAGLISTFAFGLVMAGIGALLVFYGRPYLETVSDTIRGSMLRSGGVGLAATFLAVPFFVVLVVALAVSIIGIPLLVLAVPLYPLALFGAGAFGLLAAAHAIGERTAEQGSDTVSFRYRNSYAYLFTGLGMLIAPMIAAHLIRMTGFLGFIGSIILFFTWAAVWLAATVGFGAVILSRAGTRRTFVATPPDLDYEPDPLFDHEPAAGGPRV